MSAFSRTFEALAAGSSAVQKTGREAQELLAAAGQETKEKRQKLAAQTETLNLLRKRPGRSATLLTGPTVTTGTGTPFPFITG